MELTKEDGRSIVYDCHEDWQPVEDDIIESTRWSILHKGVFKHIPTNKYYVLYWSVGATEYQDERPFECEEPKPIEVQQVEKTVKVWENVA